MNEGLKMGMFIGGIVMATVPLVLGSWFGVFLFRELRKERQLREVSSDERRRT